MKRLGAAMKRVCCSPDVLSKYMAKINARDDFDCPPPNGFAVWRVSIGDYDPKKPMNGGRVYPCLPSPPMLAIDTCGNCWVFQDQATSIMKIDAATHECLQLEAPMDDSDGREMLRMTGPGIATAPNGEIWCTLLGHGSSFFRISPDTGKIALEKLHIPSWVREYRLIHFEFNETLHEAYILSSDLLDDSASNAIIKLKFDADWTVILATRTVPLPTQDCACHRICLADVRDGTHSSLVVSEMETSKLFQILIKNLGADVDVSAVAEHHESTDQDSYCYTKRFHVPKPE